MTQCVSFPPLCANNAQLLILGTMPGIESLKQQQYYAHPRNAFWPIMAELFSLETHWSYQQRGQHLIQHNVAVWDVLKSCHRIGSLDQHIDTASIESNDFNTFLGEHRHIKHLFFNGSKAEQIFTQVVAPTLNPAFKDLSITRLPSTSPAHARMNVDQKLHHWRKITTI